MIFMHSTESLCFFSWIPGFDRKQKPITRRIETYGKWAAIVNHGISPLQTGAVPGEPGPEINSS